MLSSPEKIKGSDGKEHDYYKSEVNAIKQALIKLKGKNLSHFGNKFSQQGLSFIEDNSINPPCLLNQVRVYFMLTTHRQEKILMFIEGVVQPNLQKIRYSFYIDNTQHYFEDDSLDEIELIFQSHLELLFKFI